MTTPTAPPPQGPGYYAPPPSYQPPPPPLPAKKKHRKWPWIVLAVVVIIGIIAAANGGKKDTPSAATQAAASSVASAVAQSPTQVPAPEAAQAPVTTEAPPSTGPVAVGTPVPFVWSNYPTRAEGVATLHSATWDTTPPEFGTLKNGASLILDVTIEATVGTVNANPLYWQARDAEGRVYDYAFTSSKDPGLAAGDVVAGSKSRGFVTIDAPQVPVTVELVPVLGSTVASWSVPQ